MPRSKTSTTFRLLSALRNAWLYTEPPVSLARRYPAANSEFSSVEKWFLDPRNQIIAFGLLGGAYYAGPSKLLAAKNVSSAREILDGNIPRVETEIKLPTSRQGKEASILKTIGSLDENIENLTRCFSDGDPGRQTEKDPTIAALKAARNACLIRAAEIVSENNKYIRATRELRK